MAAGTSASFTFMPEPYPIGGLPHDSFMCSALGGHWSCSSCLAVVTSMLMDLCVCFFAYRPTTYCCRAHCYDFKMISVKGQIVHILGFVGHRFSVASA